ncbi:hypothetical protein BJX68DRAFT_22693 [Aspergillus pseudodeflectus]|uniref:J domain-containing protein n=1 Tax=Aspergillus pseudodeflectus TaxID=176178 RepID=A0ABR4KS90_9EURO
MTSQSDFDPYETLGVAKDATLADIKSSHRKLALKCHPDKIKDESLRSQAQDQFQKVQQAYELLSDDKAREKYDNKVKLAELKREMMARGAYSKPTTPREYRDGRYYEERAPADARSSTEAFFEDEGRYTASPRPTSRKHDDYGARPRSRATEEKKRSSRGVPSSSTRAAREARESTRASRADQDRIRTKERRRQAYDKFYADNSDSYDSDDSVGPDRTYYVPLKMPSSARHRDSKARPTESGRRSEARRRDLSEDEFSDERDHKHDNLYSTAQSYIRRSKETVTEDRRHRSSRSPLRYDSEEPEVSSRHSRPKRSSRDTVRPSSSRHGSREHLGPRMHEKVPSMPTHGTYPGAKAPSSPRPSHPPSRSSTNVRSSSRSNREGSRRPETAHIYPDASSRTTKLRAEKPDSGYASSSTPEATEASPKSSRHKPIILDPSVPHSPHSAHSAQPPPLRHSKTYSPPRQERRTPVRSYTYQPSTRQLFREVSSKDSHLKEELRHAREIREVREPKVPVEYIRAPHSASYRDDYSQHMRRRESASAF